jgi:hypothetical protein
MRAGIFRKTRNEKMGYIVQKYVYRFIFNLEVIMRFIRVLSATPAIYDWLANTRHPHILHVFDQSCSLINELRKVLSIVTPQVGNGPFNAVIADRVLMLKDLRVESPVSILDDQLIVGEMNIMLTDAKCWSPCPDWQRLHIHRDPIARQLAALPVPDSQLPDSLRSGFPLALVSGDISSSRSIASQLAGVGMGLTPAGDDYILGSLYATWIIHPMEAAKVLGIEISNIAAPLTTSLSAAWLRSAGKGEAGIRWHKFFSALLRSNPRQIRYTMDQILATGATSGADALAGFIGTIRAYTEMKK